MRFLSAAIHKSVLLSVLLTLAISPIWGQVTINSTSSTTSTCPNNGTITVNVNNPGPGILYSIISGPAIQGEQSSNVFSSLAPGTYVVRANDAFSNSDTHTETVTGSYQNMVFNPIMTSPTCLGYTDGKLKGNMNSFTGQAPFTWELISPSQETRGVQSSDLFENLSPGNYTVKATDNCSAFTTRVVNLANENLPLTLFLSSATVKCSETEMLISLSSSSLKSPYTITATKGGIPITLPPPTDIEYGKFVGKTVVTTQSFPGATFGDNFTVTITDGCGQTVTSSTDPSDNSNLNIAPFEFAVTTKTEQTNCVKTITAEIKPKSGLDGASTKLTFPVNYTLTDRNTNLAVATGIVTNQSSYFTVFEVPDVPASKDLTLTMTDACGNTTDIDFTSPTISTSTGTPSVSQTFDTDICLDSASIANIRYSNFTSLPKLVFLSGPSGTGSTKEGYEYSLDHTYPDTITSSSNNRFRIRGLTKGTYQYKVVDDCGNEAPGSFVIGANEASNLTHNFYYNSSCSGRNTVYLDNTGTSSLTTYRVRNNSGFDESIRTNDIPGIYDSIQNVPPGTYTISMRLGHSGTPFDNAPCNAVSQEIVIVDYESPKIYTHNAVTCDNIIYAEIIPDSTTGNPPYEYEIISGPQLFPRQTSNVFALSTIGTYRVRIYDECNNNASTADISIESASLEPQASNVSCSSAHIIYPASDYFSYQWMKPDNSIFDGDSLIIPTITPTDTGTYQIRQVITINGCSDTSYNYHNISSFSFSTVYDTICPGDTYSINGNSYSNSGIHTDTVSTSLGCDSLVYLHLFVKNYLTGSYSDNFCQGGSVSINGKTYNSSGTYYDTLNTPECDSVVTITISEGPPLHGTASGQICTGGNVTVAGDSYNTAGVYNKTIFNGTCDSLIEITIVEVANIQNTLSQTICTGQSFSVGSSSYATSGTYIDIISTATCDSIVTTNLQVVALPTVDLGNDFSMCQGENFILNAGSGHQSYSWNGNLPSTQQNLSINSIGKYSVEVSNFFGCLNSDTIEILNIYPLPSTVVSLNDTICSGKNATLTATGGNSYTWQPGNLSGSSVNVSPNTTTSYSVTSTDLNNCSSSAESVLVVVQPTPTISAHSNESLVILGEPVTLTMITNTSNITLTNLFTGELIYKGLNQPIDVVPDQDITYQIEVSSAGCVAITNLSIEVIDPIIINEVITPNGDGVNDFWVIENIEDYPDAEVVLYNRWGNVVLEEKHYGNTFDGQFNGQELPVAVYYYVIQLNFRDKIYKGSLTIIR